MRIDYKNINDDISDPFEFVRENVDILEVAQCYGIEINRHHNALCIFHEDHKPSMSFKANRFKCFSCGIGGSSIDLVAQLFSLEPLQAVNKISVDFGLNLDLNTEYKGNTSQIEERRKKKELSEGFEHWTCKTHSDYARIMRYYRHNLKQYRPQAEGEPFNSLYAEACQQLPRIEYICDILFKGTHEEKTALYKDLNRLEVMDG